MWRRGEGGGREMARLGDNTHTSPCHSLPPHPTRHLPTTHPVLDDVVGTVVNLHLDCVAAHTRHKAHRMLVSRTHEGGACGQDGGVGGWGWGLLTHEHAWGGAHAAPAPRCPAPNQHSPAIVNEDDDWIQLVPQHRRHILHRAAAMARRRRQRQSHIGPIASRSAAPARD